MHDIYLSEESKYKYVEICATILTVVVAYQQEASSELYGSDTISINFIYLAKFWIFEVML